jgi:hypothetical protein
MPLGFELASDWGDYAAHFAIDVLGTLATLYAQRFCKHLRHQIAVWFALSVLVTVSTVNLVG